ncbi:MAG: putative ester cyclase [Cryomorphaceae bacterium]
MAYNRLTFKFDLPHTMNRMIHHHDSAPACADKQGSMKGFDQEFTDIVDYILRITLRIWEGKQVGLCADYYSDDCPVYTLAGMTVGAEEVTQNTLSTLAAFPDRTLHADNIIWGGDDEHGFHTSHLISTQMTNMGDTEYGPATGKHATIQVIAHCVVKENRIVEEWLVRDNYSLVEQLGYNPDEIALAQAQAEPQVRYQEWHQSELSRVPNAVNAERRALPDTLSDTQNTEALILASLQNIWNCRMVGDVNQAYSENAELHASANRELSGHEEIAQFYISFFGTFSNLKLALDYSCQQAAADGGTDVAVRWTMVGDHTGSKLFGAPSGAPILILGESQFHVVDGKIVEEWTVFDQLAVLSQIHRARLKAPNSASDLDNNFGNDKN